MGRGERNIGKSQLKGHLRPNGIEQAGKRPGRTLYVSSV